MSRVAAQAGRRGLRRGRAGASGKVRVVKIGGSLERSPRLPALLRLLVDAGGANLVIVPGGGRFADRVRAQQEELNLDEGTAHRLAIAAMDQFAAVLCDLQPGLRPVACLEELRAAPAVSRRSTVPVWLPGARTAERPDIPVGWHVTSDSLALWLAARIKAEALILVKSTANDTSHAPELAAAGYLDGWFPEMMRRAAGVTAACACLDRLPALERMLRTGRFPAAARLRP